MKKGGETKRTKNGNKSWRAISQHPGFRLGPNHRGAELHVMATRLQYFIK